VGLPSAGPPPAGPPPGWGAPGAGEAPERPPTALSVVPSLEPPAGPAFDPAQPFDAVMLLDGGAAGGIDAPAREPLAVARDAAPGSSSYASAGPIIEGVYCKNGHFDDPDAQFCAVCGVPMTLPALARGQGERPPLGVLLLDDGSVFQLDSDYIVGREPSLDSSVADGTAKPLRIYDDSGIVSRVHVRVHLDGWRVLVTDLGSANGTRLLIPGQPPPGQPLAPQIPVMLATGSQVDLGGRGFRYESHRGR
jgi:hypothetical protein